MDLFETYKHYENYIHKLSHYPLKDFVNTKKPFKTTYSEKEELFQELTLRFFELIKKYDPNEGEMDAYIMSHLSWHAHHIGERLLRERANVDISKLQLTKEDEPLIEKTDEIKDFIDTLPERQKQVIEKIYYENMKIVDIAREMNIKKQTVVSLKKVALKKIKKHLN